MLSFDIITGRIASRVFKFPNMLKSAKLYTYTNEIYIYNLYIYSNDLNGCTYQCCLLFILATTTTRHELEEFVPSSTQ